MAAVKFRVPVLRRLADATPSGSVIRELLSQVEGVQGVVIGEGPEGEIRSIEVHVVDGQSFRRVTRDVESALMSGLGYAIDHRIVSITQNGNGLSDDDQEWAGLSESAPLLHFAESPEVAEGISSHRIELCGIRCQSDGELYCTVTVEIEVEGRRLFGQERVADTERGRQLAAGRATLDAVARSSETGAALVLEGLEEFTVSDVRGVLTLVRSRRGRDRRLFHGAVPLDRDPVEASARSVLDALNRFWLTEQA